ncbi:hypothetical protein HH212_16110 [Massilia forsythiae]|uniref:Uncharacterized protein n=1 Tax=Massilia forsythiae TaxID=2728020 RepID=A0A7Z2VY50_9BURK|nr:hypothetical protein [Massilia forsythiae]QJE01369.1 hypothetical protein HH212_16110 [Massilia forsythiae]
MFLRNDVIAYVALQRTLRILWIDHRLALAWTFELGIEHSQPRSIPLQTLADDVLGRRARLLAHDPYAAPPPPPHLPARHRALQNKAWRIVNTLQQQAPALYRPRERAALVAQCALEHGVSRPSVLRYLRRFWERGQTIDALLPDYGNSGARGKVRAATEGVKRGRPRKAGMHPGLNIDAATRAIFRSAVTRHRAVQPAGAGFSRRAAYRQMLREFFDGHDAGAVPSFGQFSYWLDRDGMPEARATAFAVQHDVAI